MADKKPPSGGSNSFVGSFQNRISTLNKVAQDEFALGTSGVGGRSPFQQSGLIADARSRESRLLDLFKKASSSAFKGASGALKASSEKISTVATSVKQSVDYYVRAENTSDKTFNRLNRALVKQLDSLEKAVRGQARGGGSFLDRFRPGPGNKRSFANRAMWGLGGALLAEPFTGNDKSAGSDYAASSLQGGALGGIFGWKGGLVGAGLGAGYAAYRRNKHSIGKTFDWLKDKWSGLTGSVKAGFNSARDVYQDIKEGASSIWGKAGDAMTSFGDNLKKGMDNLSEYSSDLKKKVTDSLDSFSSDSLVKSTQGVVTWLIESLTKRVKDAFNSLLQAFGLGGSGSGSGSEGGSGGGGLPGGADSAGRAGQGLGKDVAGAMLDSARAKIGSDATGIDSIDLKMGKMTDEERKAYKGSEEFQHDKRQDAWQNGKAFDDPSRLKWGEEKVDATPHTQVEKGAFVREKIQSQLETEGAKNGLTFDNPRAVAAAFAGQAQQESKYNPDTVHDNGTGYGMFGHRLDRKDALLSWLDKQGFAKNSMEGQSRFTAHEFLTNPKYAKLREMAKHLTPDQIPEFTRAVRKIFESPNPALANDDNRIAGALSSFKNEPPREAAKGHSDLPQGQLPSMFANTGVAGQGDTKSAFAGFGAGITPGTYGINDGADTKFGDRQNFPMIGSFDGDDSVGDATAKAGGDVTAESAPDVKNPTTAASGSSDTSTPSSGSQSSSSSAPPPSLDSVPAQNKDARLWLLNHTDIC